MAVALPWLEAMAPTRSAAAASLPAQRFLAVFTPGGTVYEKWQPTGTEPNLALSPILAPLEPVKKQVVVLDGLTMKSAVGEQRQAGLIAWLTGRPQVPSGLPAPKSFANGPSLDQVLAKQISANKKKRQSLELAVRWGTGKARGEVSPIDIANYEANDPFAPIKPLLDPAQIWRELFGAIDPELSTRAAWDKSILDAVTARYAKLGPRLGRADRRKMDEHLTRLREMEKRIADIAQRRCVVQPLTDTSGYDPESGKKSNDTGTMIDLPTDQAIPKVGKLMMDMMVMAFACDLTSVGTLLWGDVEAKYTLPWLSLPETHAFYQNDGGYHPDKIEIICRWYSEQHAYLLQELGKIDVGGHSLLAETVVFFGSEAQHPASHAKTNMPFLLAGGGGGLVGGRHVRYNGESHNDLLVSIFNLFGDSRKTFGDPAHCTGPLPKII